MLHNSSSQRRPPGEYFDIRPARLSLQSLERSWELDPDKETIDGVSARECGLSAIVTTDSPQVLRKAAVDIAYFFRREFEYDFVQYSAWENEEDDDHRAFLWTSSMTLQDDKVTVIGASCWRWREYTDAPHAYALQWIWLHPYERRKGHLSKSWPYFQKRFGPTFQVEHPYSDGMKQFLTKQGIIRATGYQADLADSLRRTEPGASNAID